MNTYERLAIFIIRLISLSVLVYFLAIAVFFGALGRYRSDVALLALIPAVLALLVFLSARFFARLIAHDLDKE
jgi:hypothetical protein